MAKPILVPIGQVKPNPKNPRIIKDEKFKKLVKSIKEFPKMLQIRPIVVNKTMMVLGGNMRLRACAAAGLKEVWIMPAEDLTAGEQKRFIISDNASYGEWDWEALANEWEEKDLKAWGVDLPIDFNKQEAEEDDFEIPEVVKTDIKLGDIFDIGDHRLICGDSTQSDTYKALFGQHKADLVVTDPPYGVAYVGKTKKALTIENDALTEEQTHNLWSDTLNAIWSFLKEGSSFYATVPAGTLHIGFANIVKQLGALRQIMIWNKGSMVMGRTDYHYKHEPILYGWKPGAAHYFTSDRTKTTVFDFDKPARNAEHPTMKPVALWAEFITNSSIVGNIVVDMFSGSGTTMVVCQQLNRRCFAVELDPRYCQVILQRLSNLTPGIARSSFRGCRT